MRGGCRQFTLSEPDALRTRASLALWSMLRSDHRDLPVQVASPPNVLTVSTHQCYVDPPIFGLAAQKIFFCPKQK